MTRAEVIALAVEDFKLPPEVVTAIVLRACAYAWTHPAVRTDKPLSKDGLLPEAEAA